MSIVNPTKWLDKISTGFFFLGFIFSKFRYLPWNTFTSPFNIVSLLLYVVGNCLWIISSRLRPNCTPKNEGWLDFTQFKNQHQGAAFLSLLGIACCFLGIAFPATLIPAFWLFVLSNILWTIAEYHKQIHPPSYDPEYSPYGQKYHVRYALLTTSISFIHALSATLIFFFPPLALFLLISSTAVSLALGLIAAKYWFKGRVLSSEYFQSSYQIMYGLSLAKSHENQADTELTPAQDALPPEQFPGILLSPYSCRTPQFIPLSDQNLVTVVNN